MQEPLTEHGSTPCEGEAAEGGEPHGRGESDVEHGCELERPPVAARQAVGVAHVESWRRNIYASKLLFTVEAILINVKSRAFLYL